MRKNRLPSYNTKFSLLYINYLIVEKSLFFSQSKVRAVPP